MNGFGHIFKVNIYGESHNTSVGVLLDGIPAGISLSEEDFFTDINRRKPQHISQTSRKESDNPIIESGIFNGYTTGTPMLIRFLNENTISKDYSNLVTQPRPGHADFVMREKYHRYNDYRGGGHTSGRVTVGLVAAGVVAKKIINFDFNTELVKLGTLDDLSKKDEYLQKVVASGDSVGGIIRVTVKNVPIGLGEPYFYSCESAISQILYSIGAVKGVSFGLGFDGVNLLGSEYNDPIIDEDGKTLTNNNGGINGGISNGMPIIIKSVIKPTPSIFKTQNTVNLETMENTTLTLTGRHDPAIFHRARVVIDSMIALCILDLCIEKYGEDFCLWHMV